MMTEVEYEVAFAYLSSSLTPMDALEAQTAAADLVKALGRSRFRKFLATGTLTSLHAEVLPSFKDHPAARALARSRITARDGTGAPILLKIVGEVDPGPLFEEYKGEPHNVDEKDALHLTRETWLDDIEMALATHVLASAIARPGRFLATNGYAVDPSDHGRGACTNLNIDSKVREAAADAAWPPLSDMNTAVVVDWLLTIDGISNGEGVGPVGRAIAALSYAADGRDSDMVWPLVGLEALYGRGKDGLQRQLMEKSEKFLGPRTRNIKQIRAIYETRSRFVHGETDLPMAFNPSLTDDPNEFHNKSFSTASMALAILVASLQRLAQEKRRELEFEYMLTPAPRPTAV